MVRMTAELGGLGISARLASPHGNYSLPILVHHIPCCIYKSRALGTLAINICLVNQCRYKQESKEMRQGI